MRVDQFIPSFSPYDAIGNHVLELRRALRSAGIGSDIYYEAIDPVLRRHARPYTEYAEKSSGRVILYHASTHSEMAQWLIADAAQGARVLVNYHNITPAEFFDFWLPEAASSMRMARQQLASLVPITELGIGDSTYNQAELDALGYAKTTRCGLMVDLQRFHDEPDARVLQSLRPAAGAGGTHWLFVGRVAPNKSQHDVVAAFAVYRKLFDPEARLSLIGSRTGLRYRRAIDKLLVDLDIGGAVSIREGLKHQELLAYYRSADVFVCLSRHEGFCVPVLEAMELGVPVLALAASAVPETVGDAAVLVDSSDPLEVACGVDRLVSDAALRSSLVSAGLKRAQELSPERAAEEWLGALGDVGIV
jgi:glycosyltransferase involved in cell wall biosynthesis